MDDNGNLTSYIGPDGDIWMFYDFDTLFAHFTPPEDYYYSIYAALSFTGEFDFDNSFGFFETYTSSLNWFYYYGSDGSICELDSDFDEEGNIIGFYILDSFDSCPMVANNGWLYSEASFVNGDEGIVPESFTSPDGEEWSFYTEEQIYFVDDSVPDE
jgi:hypothetical protein